jgi:transcriptional regulator with XRE-family HTH domain
MYIYGAVMIPGEIERKGSWYAALLEPLAAYGQGRTRDAACKALGKSVVEYAADFAPLEGFEVEVEDDGESTIYVTSNDATRLVALLLRRQRELQDMSLADVTRVMGAKSRNGWAQYEQGRSDPSVGKLEEMLAVVAPDLTIAIIPRTARVIPRWDADDSADVDALLASASPTKAAALKAKQAGSKRATKLG